MIRTLVLMAALAASLPAASIYRIEVDTQSLAATTGAFIFQFSPGLNSDPASVQFSNLNLGGGALVNSVTPVSPDQSSSATGVLSETNASNTLSISNDEAFNFYFSSLTYGSTFKVDVIFSLPTPLTGDAGGSFVLGFFSDPEGFVPALTPDPTDGSEYRQVQIDYSELGAFTVSLERQGSTATLLEPPGNGGGNEIPEPASGLLMLGAFGYLARKRFSK
jgi:hypothetical protein